MRPPDMVRPPLLLLLALPAPEALLSPASVRPRQLLRSKPAIACQQLRAAPPRSEPWTDGTTLFQLATLASSAMLVQAAIGAVVPVLPAYAESIGLTATGVGLVVSTPSLAKVVLNIPVGRLVDRWGRKGPMIIGAIIDGLGSLATAGARSLSALVPARLAVGAGSSLLFTAEQARPEAAATYRLSPSPLSSACPTTTAGRQAYLQDVVERYPERTGLLLGSVQSVGMLGFAAGPAIGAPEAPTPSGPTCRPAATRSRLGFSHRPSPHPSHQAL